MAHKLEIEGTEFIFEKKKVPKKKKETKKEELRWLNKNITEAHKEEVHWG